MSELFRKKSLIRISSPDKMDEYIKINTPSIWIILIAVLVFLAGFFIWAGLANLEDRIDVTGIQENGTLTCYVIGTESEGLSSDDVLLVNGTGYPLTSISESLMPISYDHAFWLSEEKNSLKDWDKTKQDVLSPRKVKLEYAIEEKNKALSLALELEREAKKGCCYLEENKVNDLIVRLRIQTEYVTLFKMATEAILLTRYILETEEEHNGKFWDSVIDTFKKRMVDLKKEEKHLSEFWQRTNYHPHTIYTLLDPERVECLWNKLYEKTKEVLCH